MSCWEIKFSPRKKEQGNHRIGDPYPRVSYPLLKFQVIQGKICSRVCNLSRLIFQENNLDISAKFCPVCKKKNELEAMVCVHCGALLESFSTGSATTKATDLPMDGTAKTEELLFDEAMIPVGGIAFYVAGTSRPIFSSSDKEFIIGRKVGETSDALIDLSNLGGYQLGLSRRHVTIRKADSGYEVIDISTNGTWLNGEQLIRNKPYPLASGSQLRLARMRFFVLYRLGVEAKQKT
jgi:hypothetical protein